MKISRAKTHKRMPWKNGRGETVEIAIFPEDAGVENFDWRVSMATVADDGPFSLFDGIDRTLSVIEGHGMDLTVSGRDTKRLEQSSAPFAFHADAETTARLVDGPILDLNVMTRRGAFSHKVEKIAAPALLTPMMVLTIVFCARGSVTLSAATQTYTLDPFDAAVISPGKTVQMAGSGEAFVIRIAADC
jgi:uncharacterized protein